MISNNTQTNANPARLTDIELTGTIKNLAASERKLTQILLQHIAELDRRKLYLRLSYSSLFDYLTKEIGYSEGAAQRRIDAARLLQVVPELAQKIETGSIKLAQISHMQKVCRFIKKESGQNISSQAKKDLVVQLENQTTANTEIIVAQKLGLEIKVNDVLNPKKIFNLKNEKAMKKAYQADGSVRIEFTLSAEQMQIVAKAQALLSNKTGGSLKETIVQMAESLICSKEFTKVSAAATMAVKSKGPKTLTSKLKKEVLIRDKNCQFKNHQTGQVCGSKYFLEVDHIQPRFVGGSNDGDNLRLLCRNHNQFRYRANL